jgi:uncharacterized protein
MATNEIETSLIGGQLEIVFKITERCNLDCDYCYFFHAGDTSWKQHPPTASLDVFRDVVRFAIDASRRYRIRHIGIIFHGGEPLLIKKAVFAQMCSVLRTHEHADLRFDIRLQTNATLIDDEWIALFIEYRVKVGVSLDGPRDINDAHRLDKAGKSSYDATVRGLTALQIAAGTGKLRSPGVICVADGAIDGARVYRHFVDELKLKSISLLTPDFTHDTVPGADAIAGVAQFLVGALLEWLRDDDASIRVRLFSEVLEVLLDDRRAQRALTRHQDLRHIVSVSSNGDLAPEDTLRTVHPRFSFTGLNVRTHGLDDVIASDTWAELTDASQRVPERCKGCEWWACCKGGRWINRYSSKNGFRNPSVYCSALQEIYSTLAASLMRSGVPAMAIFRRLGAAIA